MPHQLVNDGRDSPNETKAACLVKASSKPTSLAFLLGTQLFRRDISDILGDEREMGPRESNHKNKILLYGRLRMPSETFPQQTLLSNESKRIVLPFA
jgi:hypothetical protein